MAVLERLNKCLGKRVKRVKIDGCAELRRVKDGDFSKIIEGREFEALDLNATQLHKKALGKRDEGGERMEFRHSIVITNRDM